MSSLSPLPRLSPVGAAGATSSTSVCVHVSHAPGVEAVHVEIHVVGVEHEVDGRRDPAAVAAAAHARGHHDAPADTRGGGRRRDRAVAGRRGVAVAVLLQDAPHVLLSAEADDAARRVRRGDGPAVRLADPLGAADLGRAVARRGRVRVESLGRSGERDRELELPVVHAVVVTDVVERGLVALPDVRAAVRRAVDHRRLHRDLRGRLDASEQRRRREHRSEAKRSASRREPPSSSLVHKRSAWVPLSTARATEQTRRRALPVRGIRAGGRKLADPTATDCDEVAAGSPIRARLSFRPPADRRPPEPPRHSCRSPAVAGTCRARA